MLYPEIEGILNLLSTCTKLEIKRFILISCCSNVVAGKFRRVYNESHWANPDVCDMYERAKFFVEKSAWNYLENKKDSLKLTVFLPGMFLGPLKNKNKENFHSKFFKKVLNRKMDNVLCL